MLRNNTLKWRYIYLETLLPLKKKARPSMEGYTFREPCRNGGTLIKLLFCISDSLPKKKYTFFHNFSLDSMLIWMTFWNESYVYTLCAIYCRLL